MDTKIPKRIYYCWFGGNPLPEFAQSCIATWKMYCPDYEIVEINEKNFDLNYCTYVREAYEAGKWAFVSDVARLYALVNNGGIYMDTDVELKKSFDELLGNEAVCGFESDSSIATAVIMCSQGNKLFAEMLDGYRDSRFVKEDGSYDVTTNVVRLTALLKKYGMVSDNSRQTVNGVLLLPREYFCPKDFFTKKLSITDNTVAIHHFDGSWMSEEDKCAIELADKYRGFMPRKIAGYLGKFVAIKRQRGFRNAVKETVNWIKGKRK